MPNPAVGSGAAISKGKQRFKFAFYLAASGSGATYPASKLGADSEPTGGWSRQGRLLDDSINWDASDVEFMTVRAGFDRSAQAKVPRQAEDITIRIRLDEEDPDVQAKLRGTTATSLSSGSNTGTEFVYKVGQYFMAKVLLVGLEIQGVREQHIYGGKAVVTYKPVSEDEYSGLDVIISFMDVSSTETFRNREWN